MGVQIFFSTFKYIKINDPEHNIFLNVKKAINNSKQLKIHSHSQHLSLYKKKDNSTEKLTLKNDICGHPVTEAR